jgi:iron(III) transport system substrate-binding protein
MGLTDRVNPFSPSVNTNLVKPEEYPKAWEDLSKPMWKGKLALDETNVLLFTATKAEWGSEKALTFWRGIAANQPSIRSGNTETAQLLAAGEFPLVINVYTAEPGRLAEQGAPVKVIPIEPVFLQLQMVGLGAKAAHPNAAKLFINWLLDDDGQKALADNGVPAARPEILVKAAPYLANLRLLPIPPDIAVKASDDRDEWRQIMGIL